MHRATRLLPITLALVVAVAPAAFAQGQSAQSRQMSGIQTILPGGVSPTGQLDHAYTEALNAQEAVALNMTDMAANHLSNVDIVLGSLMSNDPNLGSNIKSQLSSIRRDATDLKGNLSNRNTALQATSHMVARFVSVYDMVASAMPAGGGGGAAARPIMKSPAELMANVTRDLGDTQAALAGRDWQAASLHVRDAQRHLQLAQQVAAMPATKLTSKDISGIRTLNQDVTKLSALINSRSSTAVRQAGNLVNRSGMEMTRVATATMGGGAGMGQMNQGGMQDQGTQNQGSTPDQGSTQNQGTQNQGGM